MCGVTEEEQLFEAKRHVCTPCRKDNERRKRNQIVKSGVTLNKARHLRKTYNMSVDEYLELHNKQKGFCLICKKEDSNLVIDHCHKSGKVRGLLCAKCNTAIGMLDENVETLLNAIQYLRTA